MGFNNDMTWDNLVKNISYAGKVIITRLHECLETYEEWQSFRDGRDNKTIAIALGKTEADVFAMDKAYEALKSLYEYANNGIPTQKDCLGNLRKFT